MCKKFVLAIDLQRIEPRFNAKLGPNIPEIPKLYAAAEGDEAYVITRQDSHLIQVFKFGNPPYFAHEPITSLMPGLKGIKTVVTTRLHRIQCYIFEASLSEPHSISKMPRDCGCLLRMVQSK